MMTEPRTDDVVEVVRARRFELVDHDDRVVAVLEARAEAHGESGSPTLYEADGNARVLVTGYAQGGDVSLVDAGNVTASLAGEHGLHVK
jgi:hypothetical protein